MKTAHTHAYARLMDKIKPVLNYKSLLYDMQRMEEKRKKESEKNNINSQER
jgi:hypothetical protein